MTQLRKGGPSNRRWVTSHHGEVVLSHTSLAEIIQRLKRIESDFVPNTAVCAVFTMSINGDRYATPQEVRQHTEAKNAAKLKELAAKRDRINAALDVIRKEAPGILGPEWTAEEILEEQAV